MFQKNTGRQFKDFHPNPISGLLIYLTQSIICWHLFILPTSETDCLLTKKRACRDYLVFLLRLFWGQIVCVIPCGQGWRAGHVSWSVTSGPRVRQQRKCSAANVLERSVICTNHSLTHTHSICIHTVRTRNSHMHTAAAAAAQWTIVHSSWGRRREGGRVWRKGRGQRRRGENERKMR